MTGNEIKKALECCSGYKYCQNCPCCDVCGYPSKMMEQALAYINQLEVEVERLESLNKTRSIMVEAY